LKDLRFDKNLLHTVNLTNNVQLQSLQCQSNLLVSLKLSKNTRLTKVFAEKNLFTSIDVRGLRELKQLRLSRGVKVQQNIGTISILYVK
jgi:predicted RNA-binding protein (virulence factor B family)